MRLSRILRRLPGDMRLAADSDSGSSAAAVVVSDLLADTYALESIEPEDDRADFVRLDVDGRVAIHYVTFDGRPAAAPLFREVVS